MTLHSIEMLRTTPPASLSALGGRWPKQLLVRLPARALFHVPTIDEMMTVVVVLQITSPLPSRIEMSALKRAYVAVRYGGACHG